MILGTLVEGRADRARGPSDQAQGPVRLLAERREAGTGEARGEPGLRARRPPWGSLVHRRVLGNHTPGERAPVRRPRENQCEPSDPPGAREPATMGNLGRSRSSRIKE